MPVSHLIVATRWLEALRFPPMPRPAFIPPHIRGQETAVDTEGTDLAIWTWEDGPKFMAIAFQGKAGKPLWHYRFTSEAARLKEIQQTIAARKSTLDSKAKRVQERKEYTHGIQVGDIFYTSWGYDQTSVQFYEVTALKAKAVVVREVASKIHHGDRGADYVVALPGSFVGTPMTKVPQMGDSLKIDNHYATKWDGKPKYQTAYGYGH